MLWRPHTSLTPTFFHGFQRSSNTTSSRKPSAPTRPHPHTLPLRHQRLPPAGSVVPPSGPFANQSPLLTPWVPVEGHNVVLNIVAEGPRPGSARGRGPGLGAPRPHAGPSVALGGDLRGRPPAPPLARRCPAPWRAWGGACQQRLPRPAVPRVPGTGASSPAAGWGTRLWGRQAQHGARSPLCGPEAPRAETARPPLPAPRVPSVRLTDAAVNLAPPPSAAANGARV